MKIKHLCYVAAVAINVFTPPYSEKAMAQEACGTVGLPPIGYTCYEDLVVNARTDYGHTQKFSGESTAGKGYVISRVEFINKAQFGSVSGPNIKKVESNTAYEIGSILNEESKHVEEVAKHAEVQGNNTKYVADFLDRFKKEVSARREALMKAQSNVDVVSFEGSVSGRCVTRVLGACVDSTGGKLEGYVRVHKVYIGTPESTRQFVEAAKQQILSLAGNPEKKESPALLQQGIALYRSILGRDPEAGAAEGVASRLANGSTLARERQVMANSEESRNNLANLYRTILGREPEPGAVDGLVSRLANGSSLAQEREIMTNSEEAKKRHGL